MNVTCLVGAIGKDVELRSTKSGTSVTSFGLATREFYNGEQTTQWHQITLWGKAAEQLAKGPTKGLRIAVTGSLRNREWNDRDGNKRITTEVHCNSFEYCDTKKSDPYETVASSSGAGTIDDSDIPF